MSSLSLASCSGTIGTIASRTWTGDGTQLTEIKSYGIQTRNIPGYSGISLGYHHTVYAKRSPGTTPTGSEQAPWIYGYCKGPDETPIYLQESISGAEASYSPTFVGLSCGLTSRTTAMLSLRKDEFLAIPPPGRSTVQLTYFTLHAPHEP
jgi:hypothetical protein